MQKNGLLRMFSLLLVGVLLVSLGACGKEIAFDESKKTLIVGLECNYAPFNWLETESTSTNVVVKGQNGMYAEGYDVQIARLLATDLGYNLEIEMMEFGALINALKVGKIDAIIAGMSPRSDRKESINFTNEYYRSTHVLLVDKNGAYKDAKTFDDLSNAKIIGQADTFYDDLAKQVVEKNSTAKYINPLASVPEIINAINMGVADVTIVEEPVAKGIVKAHDNIKYLKLTSNFDVKEEDVVVSIGVRKVDTTLLDKLNASLAKITSEQREALMLSAVEAQN